MESTRPEQFDVRGNDEFVVFDTSYVSPRKIKKIGRPFGAKDKAKRTRPCKKKGQRSDMFRNLGMQLIKSLSKTIRKTMAEQDKMRERMKAQKKQKKEKTKGNESHQKKGMYGKKKVKDAEELADASHAKKQTGQM